MKKIIFKVFAGLAGLVIFLTIVGYQPDVPIQTLKAKYANAASEFLTLDNLEVHYRIEGKGHPLVLLHGTGASLHAWAAILKDSFKVIGLDLPAFGLTGPNRTGDYSMDYYTLFLQH